MIKQEERDILGKKIKKGDYARAHRIWKERMEGLAPHPTTFRKFIQGDRIFEENGVRLYDCLAQAVQERQQRDKQDTLKARILRRGQAAGLAAAAVATE